MTPEERFDRIEQALRRTAELQAQHAEQLRQQGAEIEKQNEGIRSLIVVARTCLDSIQEQRETQQKDHEHVMAEIKKLREAQTATDEKLNILVDTVDRIIRHRNGQQQS